MRDDEKRDRAIERRDRAIAALEGLGYRFARLADPLADELYRRAREIEEIEARDRYIEILRDRLSLAAAKTARLEGYRDPRGP